MLSQPKLENSAEWKKLVSFETSKYFVRLAITEKELEEVFRLRYNVFHKELGYGSFSDDGLDKDIFDAQFHHLVTIDKKSGAIVGSYRVQRYIDAVEHEGFYSQSEFDVHKLGEDILKNGVEVGRACILKEYRNSSILLLLWKGLAKFMAASGLRYIYGCGSINSSRLAEARRIEEYLRKNGYVRSDIIIPVMEKCRVSYDENEIVDFASDPKIPPLFQLYLKYGTRICSSVAYDAEFKTFDFFMIMDIKDLNDVSAKMLFPEAKPA